MNKIRFKYHSELYVTFKSIPKDRYWEIIHFYEENIVAIRDLEQGEKQNIRYDYLLALFKVKEYTKHARWSHLWLQAYFDNQDFNRERIKTVLLNKAVSHNKIQEYDLAIKYFVQLQHMYPTWNLPVKYLKRSIHDRVFANQIKETSLIIGVILIILGIFSIYILFIKTLYPNLIKAFNLSLSLLGGTLIVLVLRRYWMIRKKVYSQLNEIIQKNH